MSYPTYLVHFNKNHSPRDGKFTYGDGDGDGISDDHRNQRREKIKKMLKSSPAAQAVSKIKNTSHDEYKEIQKSAAREMVGGVLMYSVGRLLAQSSNDLIANGVGVASQFAGTAMTAIGATRFAAGTIGSLSTSLDDKK